MKMKMKKLFAGLSLVAGAFVPMVAGAATDLTSIGVKVISLVNIILMIILALAFLYFVLGVIKYMTGKEAEDKKKAREQMIYGIVGLFVIFSVWGLMKILQNSLFGSDITTGCSGTQPTCPTGTLPVCQPQIGVWLCQ